MAIAKRKEATAVVVPILDSLLRFAYELLPFHTFLLIPLLLMAMHEPATYDQTFLIICPHLFFPLCLLLYLHWIPVYILVLSGPIFLKSLLAYVIHAQSLLCCVW